MSFSEEDIQRWSRQDHRPLEEFVAGLKPGPNPPPSRSPLYRRQLEPAAAEQAEQQPQYRETSKSIEESKLRHRINLYNSHVEQLYQARMSVLLGTAPRPVSSLPAAQRDAAAAKRQEAQQKLLGDREKLRAERVAQLARRTAQNRLLGIPLVEKPLQVEPELIAILLKEQAKVKAARALARSRPVPFNPKQNMKVVEWFVAGGEDSSGEAEAEVEAGEGQGWLGILTGVRDQPGCDAVGRWPPSDDHGSLEGIAIGRFRSTPTSAHRFVLIAKHWALRVDEWSVPGELLCIRRLEEICAYNRKVWTAQPIHGHVGGDSREGPLSWCRRRDRAGRQGGLRDLHGVLPR